MLYGFGLLVRRLSLLCLRATSAGHLALSILGASVVPMHLQVEALMGVPGRSFIHDLDQGAVCSAIVVQTQAELLHGKGMVGVDIRESFYLSLEDGLEGT